MQFIKTHMISLIAGVAIIAFVTVAVLGMTSTSVKKDMNNRLTQTGAKNIQALKSDPKNEAMIQAEAARGKMFDKEYEETVKVANQINKREPIMPGVFPKPERQSTPFEFKEIYAQKVKELPRINGLDAGTPPTPEEISEEMENVEQLRQLEAEKEAETMLTDDAASGRSPAVVTARQPAPAPAPNPGIRQPAGAGPRTPGGMPGVMSEGGAGPRGFTGRGMMGAPDMGAAQDTGDPKMNPVLRARVTKAKNIRCYFDDSTFQVSPIVNDAGEPAQADMWFAQVSLWVQQDVVRALAAVNKEASPKSSDDVYVEQTPVKRIVSIRVYGYQLASKRVDFPMAAPPSGSSVTDPGPAPSFTRRVSNEQYDVVRFSVSLVTDQRDVPLVIDRLTRENFFECVSARVEPVNRAQDEQAGFLYGTQPVVRVTLDFEAYMARDVYAGWMPEAVRKELGIEGKPNS